MRSLDTLALQWVALREGQGATPYQCLSLMLQGSGAPSLTVQPAEDPMGFGAQTPQWVRCSMENT